MHRADLTALKKVWVTYGQAHLPLIEKYVHRHGLEVILQFIKGAPYFTIPIPLRGFVYLDNFHMMHICALIFLIGMALSYIFTSILLKVLTASSFLAAVYFAYQYVKWNFGMEPKDKFWTWCKMKYLTNLSFIRGGLKDFKKYKVLCIEPSF
jgi:hypothetical protein